MSIIKKVVASLSISAIIFTVCGNNFAHAESDSVPDVDSTFIGITPFNESEFTRITISPEESILGEEITPFSVGIGVPKPIKAQGVLTNSALGKYIAYVGKSTTKIQWVAYLGDLLAGGTISGVIGSIQLFSSTVYNSASLDQMKTAYNKGQSMYW